MKSIALVAVASLLALLGACAGTDQADPPGAALSGPRTSSDARPGQDPHVQKLMALVVENKTFDQMRAGMPWVARLGHRYGYATNYDALTHPSLPNYLAIAGGSLFGVTDDNAPASHAIAGPSIFGSALTAGSTATLYAEGMQGACELEADGRYAVKHNPWAYFVDERDECARHDVPLDQLSVDVDAGELPAIGMVVPDMCDNAHDCPSSVANAWLRRVVGEMMTGPDWRSGRLAIVITADEDDRTDGNHILTVVAQPSLDHVVVRTPMTHYALARAYADVGGFAPLGAARRATSLLAAFGLTA